MEGMVLSYELIHLIDSPFRSRKSKYFTVFGTERIFDLLVSNKFYPTLLPTSGNLISLTVTTENLESKFDQIQTYYNKLVIANLAATSEQDNFVTHGKFSIYDVSDNIYGIYLECLNFNIIANPPLVIQREDDGKKHNEIIGANRHFQWANYSRYGKELIDATFNIIFVNFPRGNIRYGVHTDINFKGQTIPAVSVLGKMLVKGENDIYSFEFIRLLFDVSLFNEISKNDLQACVLQVYTLYNLKYEGTDIPPINFVTAAIPFFGSFEELIPFCCSSFTDVGLFRTCVIEKRILEKLRMQAVEGSPEFDKDVYVKSRIHTLHEHYDVYEFSILRTDSVLKFIRGAISIDSGKSLLESLLSSGNVQDSLEQLLVQLKSSSFIGGTLVHPNLRKVIQESFQGR